MFNEQYKLHLYFSRIEKHFANINGRGKDLYDSLWGKVRIHDAFVDFLFNSRYANANYYYGESGIGEKKQSIIDDMYKPLIEIVFNNDNEFRYYYDFFFVRMKEIVFEDLKFMDYLKGDFFDSDITPYNKELDEYDYKGSKKIVSDYLKNNMFLRDELELIYYNYLSTEIKYHNEFLGNVLRFKDTANGDLNLGDEFEVIITSHYGYLYAGIYGDDPVPTSVSKYLLELKKFIICMSYMMDNELIVTGCMHDDIDYFFNCSNIIQKMQPKGVKNDIND